MKKYVVERVVPPMSDAELTACAQKSFAVTKEMDGIKWVRSYVAASGKVYCEVEAADTNTIREHGRRAGLPVDVITEAQSVSKDISATAKGQLSPDMFR